MACPGFCAVAISFAKSATESVWIVQFSPKARIHCVSANTARRFAIVYCAELQNGVRCSVIVNAIGGHAEPGAAQSEL